MLAKNNAEKRVILAETANGSPVCKIYFPYSPVDLIIVRNLKGRKYWAYDPLDKHWTCSVDTENLSMLLDKGWVLDDRLLEVLGRSKITLSEVKEIEIPGLKGTLMPFQNVGVSFIEAKGGRALIADEMGLGKAQPWYSKVLTTTGWKQIGNLSLHDQIYGSDGQPHNIKGIYRKGIKKVYKVTFSDTSSVECCEDHLWNIKSPRDKFVGKEWTTIPLKEIMKMPLKAETKSQANLVFIPIIDAPIEFPERKLWIPPYTMGALLGDGGLTNGIKFSNTDEDIIQRVSEEVSILGYTLKKCPGENCDFIINRTDTSKRVGENVFKSVMRKHGQCVTSEYKYIPDRYKFNSVENRLELLKGLMDTDGCTCTDSKVVQFYSTSERLVDDVQFLIESLGGIAKKKTYTSKFTYKRERKIGKLAHVLTIKMPKGMNPFFCERKRVNCKTKEKYEPARAITKIEYLHDDLCYCISVDTKDHLYVTEHCILTHNTVQALAYLQLHPELRPAIIVVPASLKLNWLRETVKWLEFPNAEIVSSTTPYVTDADVIIINYDILYYWVPTLASWNPKILIMDEVHCIKNNTAKRTKAVKTLAKNIPHVIGLSGTPIINRPVEIYNAITLIDPTCVPNYWTFIHRYCGARRTRFGMEVKGATNTEELHQTLVNTIMLRRKKSDVLKDLPDKRYVHVPMELENHGTYKQAERDFISFVRQTKGTKAALKASQAAVLTEIEGLKQLAVAGKLEAAIDWIREFLESDQKLVVMAIHKFVIEKLISEFPGMTVKVDGAVSLTERDRAVEEFQFNPKVRLFVGNIQAAGVGLTLTAASNVAFLELPWTPGALVQAEDRCHRIGQKDSVTVYYLLAEDTIEERIAKLIDAKRTVLDAVLDREITSQKSLLYELMKEFDT